VTDRPPAAHRPVLLDEVLTGLRAAAVRRFIDATVGQGGHAAAILAVSAPHGQLLGMDRDPAALRSSEATLRTFGDRARLLHGSLEHLAEHAAAAGAEWLAVDGILMDLGFSSAQVDDPGRGFSFQSEGPLDMRYDPATEPSADQLVNELPERDLADLLYRWGEERRSRRVARAIVAARPLRTTAELARVVARALGGWHRIHPATRTFQALRIAVNRELEVLETGLDQAIDLLVPGGRLAVISFHSLEDRIVKRTLRDAARECVCPPRMPECRCAHVSRLRIVTRRPIVPGTAEIGANPRARSARLRLAERLGPTAVEAAA